MFARSKSSLIFSMRKNRLNDSLVNEKRESSNCLDYAWSSMKKTLIKQKMKIIWERWIFVSLWYELIFKIENVSVIELFMLNLTCFRVRCDYVDKEFQIFYVNEMISSRGMGWLVSRIKDCDSISLNARWRKSNYDI